MRSLGIRAQSALTDDDKRVINTWAQTVAKHGADSLREDSVKRKWEDHD